MYPIVPVSSQLVKLQASQAGVLDLEPYSYQPLDSTVPSTRVLLLGAGSKYADIRCQLRHELLDSDPSYEAFSYVWGNTDNRRAISLHGNTHRVTANLECALRHLRHSLDAKMLWVDALCVFFDRYRTGYCRNLRFETLFLRGFVLHVRLIHHFERVIEELQSFDGERGSYYEYICQRKTNSMSGESCTLQIIATQIQKRLWSKAVETLTYGYSSWHFQSRHTLSCSFSKCVMMLTKLFFQWIRCSLTPLA